MKRIAAIAAFSMFATACMHGQANLGGAVAGPPQATYINPIRVQDLPSIVPSPQSPDQHHFIGGFIVKDGSTSTDCTVGGSNHIVLCISNGTTYTGSPFGGGAGGGASIDNTTNVIVGDGAGNGVDSGVAASNVLTKTGNLGGLSSVSAARTALGLGAAAQLALSTTIANPGVDTLLPTEKAVRDLFNTAGGGVAKGTLAARPSTCAPGDLYSITDNTTANPGRSLSYCPQGTTSYAIFGSIDNSGLKYNSSGDLGLDLTVIPRLDGDVHFTGNLTIDGICTGCGAADDGTQLVDTNGNPTIVSGGAVTGAVNKLYAGNAATGNAPTLGATGDTNLDLNVSANGLGGINIQHANETWWHFKINTSTGEHYFSAVGEGFHVDIDGNIKGHTLKLDGLTLPTTGTRFVCIGTDGSISTSLTACSGT